MKYIYHFTLVVFALSCSLTATAQRHSHKSKIEKQLSLTPEQAAAVDRLHIEQREAFDALSEQASDDDKKAIKDSFKEKLAKILTAEQMSTLEKHRAHKRKGGHHQSSGKDKFEHKGCKHHRSLSDEQKTKLREARLAFEEQLSSEDKLLIQELRLQSTKLKEAYKENRASLTKDDKQALRDEKNQMAQSLKTIGQKYQEEIKEAIGKVKAMYQKEPTTQSGQRGEQHKAHHHKRDHHSGKKIAKFLLMDVTVTDEESVLVRSATQAELTLSPNPATSQTDIKYTIYTEGPVLIDIRNEQGQVIKTLLSESRKAGTYSLSVDLDQFQNKSYFITIKDKFTSKTEQLMIMK